MIIQNDPLIKLSVSATTRPKRPGEVDGQHYFFIDQKIFEQKVVQGDFLEYANIFDYSYGTPKDVIEKELKNGNCVIFDIDWQGARQVKERFESNSVVSIFILPPSIQELERRLKARAQDSEEVVANRMKKARDEISHFDEYDYVLVNDDLANTYQKIRSIIEAKRVSRYDEKDLNSFVANILNS